MEILLYLQEILELTNFRRNKIGISSSFNSYKIYVTSSSSADFNLTRKDRNGDVSGNDPVLSFNVGDQVTFIIDTTDFYLKTKPGIDTGNKIDVENNGMGNDSIVWTPSGVGTFYYQCVLHTEMVGKITIKN